MHITTSLNTPHTDILPAAEKESNISQSTLGIAANETPFSPFCSSPTSIFRERESYPRRDNFLLSVHESLELFSPKKSGCRRAREGPNDNNSSKERFNSLLKGYTHTNSTHGTARHGTARHGTARHGTARHGTARHGTARPH